MTDDDAKAFIRAGGSVSLTEWVTLPAESKLALFRAGDALRQDVLLVLAKAMMGRDQAEEVFERLCGEENFLNGILVRAAMHASKGKHHG